jgi:hypothetical protein
MSKKDFTTRAKAILNDKGTKPSSMEEFLKDDDEPLEAGMTENQNDGKLENRHSGNTEEASTINPESARTERYEWRHTPEMGARIQRLLLELNQERKPKKHKIKIVDLPKA